jgi:ferric enterobactin receptor
MLKLGKVLPLLLCIFLLSNNLYAQSHRIFGKVTDLKKDEPIIGATVFVKNTSIGTATSEIGYFYLTVPSDTCVISVNFIGYETQYIRLDTINLKKKIEIKMMAGETDIEEVIIKAEKEKIIRVNPTVVSSVSISPELIAKLPSFGEVDIMRAFQLLPGISGSNETSAGLYVRGGTPDQNLILFDGMTIYHVDHFYGFFSAFNANSVDDVELIKGGFPAEYGGRTSSVLNIIGKPADLEQYNFGGGLSLLSGNVFAEIPIIKKKLSLQVSGRRSYTDILQSGLYEKIFDMYNDAEADQGPGGPGGGGRPGMETETFSPSFFFYDVNSKLTYKHSKKDLFTLSFYSGKDELDKSRDQTLPIGDENTIEIIDVVKWGNIGVSGSWQRKWTDKLISDMSLSYSNYFSLSDRKTNIESGGTSNRRNMNMFEDNNVKDVSYRLNNNRQLLENNLLKFGAQITYNDISYQYVQNDTSEIVNTHDYGTQYLAFIQDEHKFFDKLFVNAGFRTTYYDVTNTFYYEPRLSAVLELPWNFKFKAAWGMYNQFISRTVREDVLAGSKDFWVLAEDENVPVSSSIQYVAGIEWEPDDYLFGAEVFYKDMKGLSEFSMRYTRSPDGAQLNELFFSGSGVAKGIEFLAQKKIGKMTGWLAYTLSSVIHEFPNMNNGLPFYALHDQTHEFKAVYSHQVNDWDFSATFIYASGTPYTAPEGVYQLTLLDGTVYDYIHVSDKNSYRLPDYHRLDISAGYNFRLGKSKASLGISIFNLYDHDNIWYKEYDTDEETGQLIETNITKLGITPNVSFRVFLHK